jgi:membrane protein implicated in regulation of membrane protease activity
VNKIIGVVGAVLMLGAFLAAFGIVEGVLTPGPASFFSMVGFIIKVLVVVAAAVFLIWFIRRSRRRQNQQQGGGTVIINRPGGHVHIHDPHGGHRRHP